MDQRGRRCEPSRVALQRRPLAFLLTALLAVFLQTFVVQTHVHVSGATYSIGYSQQTAVPHDLSIDASAAGDHQVACLICQALTTAGTAMLASAAIVVATAASNGDTLLALTRAPRVHTHSWRSRAPPSFL